MKNNNPERMEVDQNGFLDEIFFKGGVHLERMDKESWYLNCIRENGSSVVLWFKSKDLHLSDREERNR